MSAQRTVQSEYFVDLQLIIRPGISPDEFTQPPRIIQAAYRAAATTGWRLRRSRARVQHELERQEADLKGPLRALFRSGPVNGVIRTSPRGGRVWVTQAKSKVPVEPRKLVKFLGKDAPEVIEEVSIDPIIVSQRKLFNGFLAWALSNLKSYSELPVRLKVNHEALERVLAERGSDIDISEFFEEVDKGEPRIYTKPD